MSRPLPLADAARRLRKRAGRPRTRPVTDDRAVVPSTPVRPPTPAFMRARVPTWPGLGPSEQAPPRLLGVEAAAHYLGRLSPRSVRTLIDTGIIHRVRVPLGDGELRRVLVDRLELDVLIEQWKDGADATRNGA